MSGGDFQDLLSVGQDVIILQLAAIANEGNTACVVLIKPTFNMLALISKK